MIRATTPTFTLTVKDDNLNLGLANHVYVTISQGHTEITKSGEYLSIENNVVEVWLAQQESLRLSPGDAKIQINWTCTERRAATRKKTFPIEEQLLQRVIT